LGDNSEEMKGSRVIGLRREELPEKRLCLG
jgi:hypothetical protein